MHGLRSLSLVLEAVYLGLELLRLLFHRLAVVYLVAQLFGKLALLHSPFAPFLLDQQVVVHVCCLVFFQSCLQLDQLALQGVPLRSFLLEDLVHSAVSLLEDLRQLSGGYSLLFGNLVEFPLEIAEVDHPLVLILLVVLH